MRGEKVIVVGGSSGIGLATAKDAISRGARVTITGRSEAKLKNAAGELGEAAEIVVLDATDEEGMRALFERLGSIDHVFITVGEVAANQGLESPGEELRAAMDTRFLGALYVAKHATPRIRPGGSITFMSGTAGLRPLQGMPVASASCGAIEALARALAVELAPVRVNAIRPGFIDTPLLDELLGEQRDAVVTAVASKLPVQRIGRADEVADAVFLMRNEYITGTCLSVDGGGLLV